jgi:hypothetical protein
LSGRRHHHRGGRNKNDEHLNYHADYSIDPEAMSTEAIERELRSYAPATGQLQL